MGDRIDWRGSCGISVMRGMTTDMRRIREMEFPELQTIGYVRVRLDEPTMLDLTEDEDDDFDDDDDPIGSP